MTFVAKQVFVERFTVVKLLGEGGMGEVYEVTDGRFAGRRRALKVLHAGKEGDPRARDLFEKEVTATARIESEHVVEVIEYDVKASKPWMLMELLEGESLDARVASQGPLEWTEARRRVSELGHALGAAHRVGLLHLDLKPGNLFLARRGDVEGSTRLKVLDFGLSRQVLDGKTHVVQSVSMGTRAWMPPEQFNRKAEMRPSADVWPLGLIAFWMLTARYYWNAIDEHGVVDNELALSFEINEGATTTASRRAEELGVGQALPVGFDEWFAKCLAKDEAKRWNDGGEASRALDDVLGRASGSVAPRAPAEEPRRASARGPTEEVGRPSPPVGLTEEVDVVLPAAAVPAEVGGTKSLQSLSPRRLHLGWIVGFGVAVAVAAVGVSVFSKPNRTRETTQPKAGEGNATTEDSGTASAGAIALASARWCPSGMRLIPPGRFIMGVPNGVGQPHEQPEHQVHSTAFCMDETEVTVAAYRLCVQSLHGCEEPISYSRSAGGDIDREECNWRRQGSDSHPVNCLSKSYADQFCRWSNKRLPTEAEWEYAARGSQRRIFAWGDNPPTPDRANLFGEEGSEAGVGNWRDGFVTTAPVGSFLGGNTPEGISDMTGNVAEWVSDDFDERAYASRPPGFDAQRSVVSPDSYCVTRGGSFGDRSVDSVRCSSRHPLLGNASPYVGFRCVAPLR